MLIEISAEYDRRRATGRQRLEHPEPVDPRHLDVEKNQIGITLLNDVDGLLRIATLADHFHIALDRQEPTNSAACQRFVIHYERLDFCYSRHCLPAELAAEKE